MIIEYVIMSCMVGFTGNKLFNKKDKSNSNSIRWAFICGSFGLGLYVLSKIK